MGRKSRDKGNNFELDIAKKLSEWWGVERAFRRTPLSGAWDKRMAPGDLVLPDGFPLEIECKNFEGWDLLHLFTCPEKGLLNKYWRQAVGECRPNLKPMMAFTRNFMPAFFMMWQEDYEAIVNRDDLPLMYTNSSDIFEKPRVIGMFEDLLRVWDWPRPATEKKEEPKVVRRKA